MRALLLLEMLFFLENDPNQQFISLCKSYAPVAFGSQTFTQSYPRCQFLLLSLNDRTPNLGNVIQFNFVIAYIQGAQNTVADQITYPV